MQLGAKAGRLLDIRVVVDACHSNHQLSFKHFLRLDHNRPGNGWSVTTYEYISALPWHILTVLEAENDVMLTARKGKYAKTRCHCTLSAVSIWKLGQEALRMAVMRTCWQECFDYVIAPCAINVCLKLHESHWRLRKPSCLTNKLQRATFLKSVTLIRCH